LRNGTLSERVRGAKTETVPIPLAGHYAAPQDREVRPERGLRCPKPPWGCKRMSAVP
jgi:hypothetical protein